jgi:HD-GYP domain-containing protein (c-di-GMP phosphodiesterase class II)
VLSDLCSEHDEVTIESMLADARSMLGMDFGYVAEFCAGEQVMRYVDGDARSFGQHEGRATPLAATFCQMMVRGEIPCAIPATELEPRVARLPITREARIGAYVGVPITLSNGRVYGSLCCLDHHAAAVGERDVRLLRLLARLVARALEREGEDAERARLRAQAECVHALLAALAARDDYTGTHSGFVVELASGCARVLGLDEAQLLEVRQVAVLHDIGKVGIPDRILLKPGPLTPSEWNVMRRHPEIGARIIDAIASLAHLAPAIRAEHERFDGAGYPDGLAGEDIPLASRIVLACDAFHAMVSDRPYRQALLCSDARAELEANAGSQFDPRVVGALLGLREAGASSARANGRSDRAQAVTALAALAAG